MMLIGALYPIGSVVQGAIADALGDRVVTAADPAATTALATAEEPTARNSRGD
jgi:hypothetical protein